jgi:type I restriction enzyme R subunit
LTEQVSILDAEAFEKELEKIVGTRAKAEMIASRTTKHITVRMEEDPVFYKKLSELIRQTIADLRAMRISEAEALRKVKEYREQAVTKKGDDVPDGLLDKEEAIAFYRLLKASTTFSNEEGVDFSNEVDTTIKKFKVVDWQNKLDVIRKMNFFIGEYLIDHLNMSIKDAEALAEKCVEVAKLRYQ